MQRESVKARATDALRAGRDAAKSGQTAGTLTGTRVADVIVTRLKYESPLLAHRS